MPQPQRMERFFSIELDSKEQLKNVCMTKEGQKERVFIEGAIGDFVEAGFVEGVIFEVRGSRGTLRLDLRVGEVRVEVKHGE